MNWIKRILHLLLMGAFLALMAGVLLSSCGQKDFANVQALAEHLSYLQEHPFPSYSEGEFLLKSPLMRQKLYLRIWSDGVRRMRIEYMNGDVRLSSKGIRRLSRMLGARVKSVSGSKKGDFIVIDYTRGLSLTYHRASNTYSIARVGELQTLQPIEEVPQMVVKALNSGAFKYDGIFRMAGEKAYKFEVDYKKIDPSSGFDKTSFWVDSRHWTLLGVEVQSFGTTMKWQAREVRFDVHPDEKLFSLTPPPGATKVQPEWEKDTRAIGLGSIRSVLGRDPLLPNWLPKGYELVGVRASDESRSVGMLYRRRYLLGTKEITIEEIALRGKEGPLGIEDCKNEKVQVHGKKAMYSKCKIGSTLMWDEGGLQIMISGFESKSTMLKIAESMR